MSDLCIYLPLEDYLAQWFVNEHGGERPVHLLRGSIESKALETYLEKLPEELHHFGKIGRRQDELIYAWMEKHRIDPTEKNWNAIAKRYQRQRNIYMMRERAKKQYSRKKSH